MEIEVTTSGDCHRLGIRGEINVSTVKQLLAEVAAGMARCQVLDLDLSGVTNMDSVGLQLLIAADKTARRKNKDLWLTDPSREVRAVMELSELTSYFSERIRIVPRDAEASSET